MDALTALIHEDATQSMPPYDAVAARPRGHPRLVARARAPAAAARACIPTVAANGVAGVRPVQAERRAARATSRGRSRCSRSRTAGSSSSRSSSTPTRCSRSSACPHRLERQTDSVTRLDGAATDRCLTSVRPRCRPRSAAVVPAAVASVRQNVRQAHERDELEQVARCVTQANLAAVPSRGELQPRERVDRHRVGVDAARRRTRDVGATPPPAARRSGCKPSAGRRARWGRGWRTRPSAALRLSSRGRRLVRRPTHRSSPQAGSR